MEQIGPITQIIARREYKSCSGCKFYSHRLIVSGHNPKYANNCTNPGIQENHPAFTISSVGNLDDDGCTPDWCPILNPPVHFTPGRRMGNTSRLADHIIQELFKGKTVTIRDHHQGGDHHQANEHLRRIVLRRLSFEHNINPENIKSSLDRLTISLREKGF